MEPTTRRAEDVLAESVPQAQQINELELKLDNATQILSRCLRGMADLTSENAALRRSILSLTSDNMAKALMIDEITRRVRNGDKIVLEEPHERPR